MDILDDQGRLFGVINVIDAFAVLLLLAVVAVGTGFVITEMNTDSSGASPGSTQALVTVQVTDVRPYVANALPEGSVDTASVVAVKNKSIRPAKVIVEDQNGVLHERNHPQNKTVTARVVLQTRVKGGELWFASSPLKIGRKLTLDLGPVVVRGRVTQIPNHN